MTIVLGSDHGGFQLKEKVKEHISKNNIDIIDVGTYNEDSVDYPDIAIQLAKTFEEKKCDYIFAFCGTGIGISIALNKIENIYAALIYNKETAILAKEHNNANAIVMGGRQLSIEQSIEMVDAFFKRKCTR